MKVIRAGFVSVAVVLLAVAPTPARAQSLLPPVKCKDGTTTTDRIRPCDKHGGVAPKPPAPAGATPTTHQNPGESGTSLKPGSTLHAPGKDAAAHPTSKAKATCKDGTKSYALSHSGACSGHGGVAEWLDGTATKKP